MAPMGFWRGGLLATVVLLAALQCARGQMGSGGGDGSGVDLIDLNDYLPSQSGAVAAGCLACNEAQVTRCFSNLQASQVWPADFMLEVQDTCELMPAMEAFWRCLKACAGEGACPAKDIALIGEQECQGIPIPCSLGGCPECPVGFKAKDLVVAACEKYGTIFEDYGCPMDCGVNVCGNCPPDLPSAHYEHDLAECNLES
jgi:hypothetical protein